MREETEFRCPMCGSERFGSSGLYPENKDLLRGHCHGDGCKFSWQRSDDYKYFRLVRYYDSASEYEHERRGMLDRRGPQIGQVS